MMDAERSLSVESCGFLIKWFAGSQEVVLAHMVARKHVSRSVARC